MTTAGNESLRRLGSSLGLGLVQLYRGLLSAQLGGACRFEPSCSTYAAECFARHGLIAGTKLALARVWRCRPGVPGGIDPAP